MAQVNPRLRLHLVKTDRPLGPLTRAEKLALAIAYLRDRNLYLLDRGTCRPQWGVAGEIPQDVSADLARIVSEMDRRAG